MSYTYPFPMVSAAATIVIINRDARKVLLGLRSKDTSAYPCWWSVPGGFLDAKVVDADGNVIVPGETVEQTAVREVEEETALIITEDQLNLFRVSSNPETDKRAHVINTCFYVVVNDATAACAVAGDDLEEIWWADFDEAQNTNLAFDHNTIVSKAIEAYLKNA